MSICRYCGQKAGWFSEAHEGCIQKVNQGIEALSACIANAIVEGKEYAEIEAQLGKVATDAAAPEEEVRRAIKEGWSKGAEKRSIAQPIGEPEFSAISDFYHAAGLTQDDVFKTAGFRAMVFSLQIWTVLNDQISPYQGPIRFNLQEGEVPVSGMANVLLSDEQTRSSYVGSYAGASIKVASGLYYHFGGVRGHREQSTSLQEIDYGYFLMTTRAVYFGGTEKGVNFRLPYKQIVRFQPYSDAVGICKNGAKEKIFAPQQVPEAGWFLFNVLLALAAKDCVVRGTSPSESRLARSG
jgi:hypothetical protein